MLLKFNLDVSLCVSIFSAYAQQTHATYQAFFSLLCLYTGLNTGYGKKPRFEVLSCVRQGLTGSKVSVCGETGEALDHRIVQRNRLTRTFGFVAILHQS